MMTSTFPFSRYSKEDDLDDMERDLGDEYGWKQVHGDVFRPAASPLMFSALIGKTNSPFKGHLGTFGRC